MRLARRNKENIVDLQAQINTLKRAIRDHRQEIENARHRIENLEREHMTEFERLLADYNEVKKVKDSVSNAFSSGPVFDRYEDARQALQDYCEANGCDDPTEDGDD